MNGVLQRDERELMVDQAANRWSYLVISYGLLAIVIYRSVVGGAASWDLLGLVILGGLVGTAYRVRQRAVSRPSALVAALAAALAVVAAVLLISAARVAIR